jgi:hypothetical protein
MVLYFQAGLRCQLFLAHSLRLEHCRNSTVQAIVMKEVTCPMVEHNSAETQVHVQLLMRLLFDGLPLQIFVHPNVCPGEAKMMAKSGGVDIRSLPLVCVDVRSGRDTLAMLVECSPCLTATRASQFGHYMPALNRFFTLFEMGTLQGVLLLCALRLRHSV